MFWRSLLLVAAFLVVGGLGSAACGDDDDDEEEDGAAATTAPAGGGTAVAVELNEFVVTADPDSVDAGEVNFTVENIGAETHEFVIVKTELAEDALPTIEDGSVDEEGAGIEVVDEIEDIASETTKELTVDMEAGSYVLFCNIVEEEGGEPESHYAEGMHTSFSVE
jgi:uncharacterized cupredoxin-like copper-binding protein